VTDHDLYMRRCIELARLGAGNTAPNPMVGAVLVHAGRIIGEGYHEKYGGPHAEPNCIADVLPADMHLISQSTLYVSLEPCSHFGKTPPCADLIIKMQIPNVMIGCRDSFEEVNGSGIEKMKAAGINVVSGILEQECRALNKRFFTFHEQQRPYIILKWAQSNNGKISGEDYQPIKISNKFTDRLVHKWRSQEAAILIGANTALHDNPSLTTRLWKGNNPVRVLLDNELIISQEAKFFNEESKTIIINSKKEQEEGANFYRRAEKGVEAALSVLYEEKILSVIIEGGAKTLQAFINSGCWDEARVITNNSLIIPRGLAAPQLKSALITKTEHIFSDKINYYTGH
jgi:diaminohydroxyphosphoribosylaminopyrimidine deaminase/5-amino-6-(5-phosphoribosylamino)uracil reductase